MIPMNDMMLHFRKSIKSPFGDESFDKESYMHRMRPLAMFMCTAYLWFLLFTFYGAFQVQRNRGHLVTAVMYIKVCCMIVFKIVRGLFQECQIHGQRDLTLQ